MKRLWLVALALLSIWMALPAPAAAQVAVGANGAKDWFKLGKGQDAQEILSPMGQIAYDITTNDAGTQGLSFSYRALSSMDAGDTGELVSELSVEKWQMAFDNSLEWFVGIKGEAWAKDLVGETKFLGGGSLGTRFDVGVPFQVSLHGAAGPDGVAHWGAFFGVRLSDQGEGG